MPDRTDSGQGRDALDAALDAYLEAGVNHYLAAKGLIAYTNPQNVHAARAAVRKAAREMGEECVVEELLYGKRIVSVQTLKPGDRVRVIRVEGGK